MDNQKAIMNEFWTKQERFMTDNTNRILEQERQIATDVTNIMVNGLVAGFAKVVRPTPEKTTEKSKYPRSREDAFFSGSEGLEEDDYESGLDSALFH